MEILHFYLVTYGVYIDMLVGINSAKFDRQRSERLLVRKNKAVLLKETVREMFMTYVLSKIPFVSVIMVLIV